MVMITFTPHEDEGTRQAAVWNELDCTRHKDSASMSSCSPAYESLPPPEDKTGWSSLELQDSRFFT